MADSRCCFGCSNVRKGAWVIAVFDMVICILFTLKTLSMLNFTSYQTYKKQQHTYIGDDISSIDNRPVSMESDFNIFCQLFILFLFFYVNLNLKKATYIHNVQSINQWLVTNSIFFIFFVLCIGFITLRYSTSDILSFGVPLSIIIVYQIYVIKHFYDDELKFLAASDRNAGPQPALGGTSYVTITSQSVQSTAAYPVQPPTSYPVQTGPYVIQQTRPPVTQTPYPQQTHQYQPQHQPQIHQAHSPLEPYAPQEYCNPPPYSPTYNMQESSSTKQ